MFRRNLVDLLVELWWVYSLNAGVNGTMMNGMIHGDTVVAFEEDDVDILYDPFDRPPGEVITQVWPRSRSRSPRRSRSV